MGGYYDTNDDDNSCYKDKEGNTEDAAANDNDGNVNTDSEEEDENYDCSKDEDSVSNDMLKEYDWKSIRDSDIESVTSLPH